jgi:hypothetical protein
MLYGDGKFGNSSIVRIMLFITYFYLCKYTFKIVENFLGLARDKPPGPPNQSASSEYYDFGGVLVGR